MLFAVAGLNVTRDLMDVMQVAGKLAKGSC